MMENWIPLLVNPGRSPPQTSYGRHCHGKNILARCRPRAWRRPSRPCRRPAARLRRDARFAVGVSIGGSPERKIWPNVGIMGDFQVNLWERSKKCSATRVCFQKSHVATEL